MRKQRFSCEMLSRSEAISLISVIRKGSRSTSEQLKCTIVSAVLANFPCDIYQMLALAL